MKRGVEDRNVLEEFVLDFCKIVDKHTSYIIGSGFVAIATGRTRATEDIGMILPKLTRAAFTSLHLELKGAGFKALQSASGNMLYDEYLRGDLSIRYVRTGVPVPEMEIKFAKDSLDDYQLQTRTKLPLTGLDVWFGSIEMNIAYKEELLKSEKDMEDAEHLRKVFVGSIDEKKIKLIKGLIRKHRG